MVRTEGYMADADNVSLLSTDMKVVEDFLNKDIRSTTLPEEVYWVLSVITNAFYGRRCSS